MGGGGVFRLISLTSIILFACEAVTKETESEPDDPYKTILDYNIALINGATGSALKITEGITFTSTIPYNNVSALSLPSEYNALVPHKC